MGKQKNWDNTVVATDGSSIGLLPAIGLAHIMYIIMSSFNFLAQICLSDCFEWFWCNVPLADEGAQIFSAWYTRTTQITTFSLANTAMARCSTMSLEPNVPDSQSSLVQNLLSLMKRCFIFTILTTKVDSATTALCIFNKSKNQRHYFITITRIPKCSLLTIPPAVLGSGSV